MSFDNSVRDFRGYVIGFRCDICDQVKTKMWDTICNECRLKYPQAVSRPPEPDQERP